MKKFLLLAFTTLLTLPAIAETRVAVVDLQQLVSSSTQVKQLKEDHSKKIKELEKIIINARGEISNENEPSKILLLEEKYTKEFNTKKEAIDKEYNSKLATIEKNILKDISAKAQKESYDYVFAKSVVLYGGNDITSDLQKNIK